jgi:hypothetical protein
MKNKTIKQKQLGMISIKAVNIAILLIVLFLSIFLLKDSISKIVDIEQKVIQNKKLIAIHEKYMGEMCRSVVNQENFSSTSTHQNCPLGKWYYPFIQSQEYNILPNNIKSAFSKMEESHKFIHLTAKDYQKNYTFIDKKLEHSLVKRELEHILWLSKVEESLLNKKVFKDSSTHKTCNFGKWFYSYTKTSEFNNLNENLRRLILSMEDIHRNVHQSIFEVVKLQKTK